jgi:hypothetical protein
MVLCESGSAYLYIDGRAREIQWVTKPRPEGPQAGQVTYVELNPVEVQFGRWSNEDETFVATRKMTVEEFLNLSVMARRSASAG